jgi:hypothetical protein
MASHRASRKPGRGESLASLAVLLVLAGIVAALAFLQSRFNPAVRAMASAAAGPRAAKGMPEPPPDLLAAWPDGVRPLAAAERFDEATLSDKIDGKAELYLAAGFKELRCQRAAKAGSPAWMEVEAFDMGEPANAFSVFSTQRRKGAPDARVGDHSYLAGNALCFVHGPFYVEIVASEPQPALMEAAAAAARRFVEERPVAAKTGVAGDEALFPRDALVPGSLALLASDVFGFDRLDRVFLARAKDGKAEVALFVSRRASPAEAAKLAADYRAFLVKDCGGKEAGPAPAPPGAAAVALDGMVEVVFASGPVFAGVHQAPSREVALRWAARLAKSIGQHAPPNP